MDLRSVANQCTRTINDNELVSVLISDGYTIGTGAKQVPKYLPAQAGYAQVQALDNKDLQQLDGLNIQGDIRAAYLYGPLAGVVRPEQVGGDLIKRNGGTETWLIVKVLETWRDWTKVAIVLQSVTA